MSTFIKDKLKLLKTAVQTKDWPSVEKHANAVLSFESINYNARVFLALACTNLERFDQAEEEYKKAIEISPSQLLARQGLASFYEKRQRWTEYAQALNQLLQQAQDAQDAPKYAESLAKLIEVKRAHGTSNELAEVLSLLLRSSPSYPLLSTLPPAQPTNPTATSYHSVQLALISSLPTLLELLSIVEASETSAVEAEIKKRRQRLGGPSLSAAETRRIVCREFMVSSQLPGLYRTIIEDPDASEQEELRRSMEGRLLRHWTTLLQSLPSTFDEPTLNLTAKVAEKKTKGQLEEEERLKNSIRWEIEQLAKGMALIGVSDEQAWQVELDWSDQFAIWDEVDWEKLEKFAGMFPETGLASIISLVHRYHMATGASEHSDTTEADETMPIVAPTAEEFADVAETGLQKSPHSILGHLLIVRYFVDQEDWTIIVAITEAGLQILRKREAEIGRALEQSRRTLEKTLSAATCLPDPR